MKSFLKDESGQTATEYMLILSVIVIAVVATSYTFLPKFREGVIALSERVFSILDTGMIEGMTDAQPR